MALHKLTLPKMGESVTEATVTNWLREIGDLIQEDESVLEVATDKVDSDVPSPVQGVLKERFFENGDVVQVGDVIAVIETDAQDEPNEQNTDNHVANQEDDIPVDIKDVPGLTSIESLEDAQHTSMPTDESKPNVEESSDRFYSPLVRSIAQEEGISLSELDQVHGSGAEGRVTKDDVLKYLAQKGDNPTIQVKSSDVSDDHKGDKEQDPQTGVSSEVVRPKIVTKPVVVAKGDGDEIMEMDRMRRLIADHMVSSVHTSPHVFSAVEADVTNLVNWRNQVKDGFKKREGQNITFTPLIIEAISKALKDFPMINVSVDGYNIIRRKHINIGMATALPNGNLIVPVIKDADQLSLLGISHAVNDLAQRSRDNKLKPDDTQGGTFTFTNIGAFGNIFGMPIINQPQAAILAVGTIKKKPAVIETPAGDLIGIRHFMYITMSYDHRVIDGALGGTFIKRVADYLENWDLDRTV
ncbi:dihydrolipoamide acetyltransferase family protein [Sphingobacterium corticibacter]|uniref:Dihydrolipoamide acetyltransferase component of pyruvate dehydrogenase complex n=1 Tax=Sphingobacterium corticibacter TaxID=2171749 RepID=A0A2T8HLS5_9SPHI|nr:dihydrolipoamide acetyltransferase family protein [Sphingobacterium corticibacter]PVH26385.1 diapophytoene dehydrogenase [Sphingobacterium corticibacter]